MADKTWHGRQASVEVGPTLTIPDTTESSDDIGTIIDDNSEGTWTPYTGDVLDITITDPEASIALENTFGGQFKVEEPAELVEIEVTMRFQDQDPFSEIHGDPTDINGEWTRIEGTKEPGNRKERSFLFELEDNGDIVRYFCNKAVFQSFGEVSLDADGFTEITGVVVCLVEDRFIEQNF